MNSAPVFARASWAAYSNDVSVLATDNFMLLMLWSATVPITLLADCIHNRRISLDSIITHSFARNALDLAADA
jgi:hypothetical protein